MHFNNKNSYIFKLIKIKQQYNKIQEFENSLAIRDIFVIM